MSGANISPEISFDAGEAIAPNLRVKHGATVGQVDIAGDEVSIGNALGRAYAQGDPLVVIDKRAPGTRTFIAGGAIAKGDNFTSAANGKVVTGTGGAEDYGVAINAAGGDGEHFEGTIS